MPRDALTAPAGVGWVGKLPARGDFIGGGRGGPLLETLRRWAEEGLAAVRAGGGPARDAFLTAPLWRLGLGAGSADGAPGVAVVGPGMDAAGRLFPVIVARGAAPAAPRALLAAHAAWCDAVENAALAALAPDADPAAFDAAVASAPGPAQALSAMAAFPAGRRAAPSSLTLGRPAQGAAPAPADPPQAVLRAETGGPPPRGFDHPGGADGALFAALFAALSAPAPGEGAAP